MPRRRRETEDDDDDESQDELERAEEALRQRQKEKGKSREKDSGRKKERRRRRDSTSGEEEQADEEQEGRGSKSKGKNKVSDGTVTELARALVRYAICNEASKKPLRRDEINKRVLVGNTRSFAAVLDRANVLLKNSFGMEIVELFPRPVEDLGKTPEQRAAEADQEEDSDSDDDDGRRKKKKGGRKGKAGGATDKKTGSAKTFCLRTTLPLETIQAVNRGGDEAREDEQRLDSDVAGALGSAASDAMKEWKRADDTAFDWKTGPEQRTLMGILHVILALIMVNERVLTDEQLMANLKRLNLRLETTLPLHPSALKPEKQTLNTFLGLLIKQGYLEKTRLSNPAKTGGATQAGAAATQRVRATQATQRAATQAANDDEAGKHGNTDEEWRWGPRAFKEIGEDGIAGFILDFYKTRGNIGRDVPKPSKELLKDITKGAAGGEGKGGLQPARDDDDE